MTLKSFAEIWLRYILGAFFLLGPALYFLFRDETPSVAKVETVDLESKAFLETTFNVFARDIYSASESLIKIPKDLATPIIINWKIGGIIEDLPLEAEVKNRVLERIDTDEFVDEVVPFIFTLKEQYAPGFSRPDSFEKYVKSYFSKNAPGAVHTLFEYNHQEAAKPDAATPSMFSLENKKMMAQMVTLYDAIFLRPNRSPLFEQSEPTPETIKDVQEIIRSFLAALEKSMDPTSEAAEGIRANLKSDEKLETLTITLITSVSMEAYKAYQMFASKVYRMNSLNRWMQNELDQKNGGKLWEYLRYANNGRKYAVQVVVDGLQGHLVKNLALNKFNSPFMQQLSKDQESPKEAPQGVDVRTTSNPQLFNFLEKFKQSGFAEENFLPNFRSMLNSSKNSIALYGISSTPTISVRNLPIAWTGASVAGPNSTGIPNFHFVDRKANKGNGRAYYFFGNDAVLLESLAKKAGMKTMFERLPEVVSLNCNAQYDSGAKASFNPFLNLALGEKIRNFGDALCVEVDLKQRLANEMELRKLREELLELEENIKDANFMTRPFVKRDATQLIGQIANLEDQGMPQYVLYYNPWADHYAHGKGPFSDEILSPTGELNRLDYWLGQIQTIYKQAGLYNRTLFAIAGDHGLTPVKYQLNPEVEVFKYLIEKKHPIVVEKISSDEGEGPKMNHPINPPSMRKKDVVIASTAGGNYMLDFFLTDASYSFYIQPLYQDLTHWKTLAGQKLPILDILTERLKDSLDYAVVREEPCSPQEGKVRLMAYRNGKPAKAFVTRKRDKILYQFESDLLDVLQPNVYSPEHYDQSEHQRLLDKCLKQVDKFNPETWCSENDWTLLTSYTNRIDSVVQISHLYDTDRAGTVNLFPKQGIGYNTKVPGRHAGEHFHEKDAMVGFWGAPTLRASQQLRSAANGSLAPTVYEWITGKKVVAGKEGWGYPSLLDQVTK